MAGEPGQWLQRCLGVAFLLVLVWYFRGVLLLALLVAVAGSPLWLGMWMERRAERERRPQERVTDRSQGESPGG